MDRKQKSKLQNSEPLTKPCPLEEAKLDEILDILRRISKLLGSSEKVLPESENGLLDAAEALIPLLGGVGTAAFPEFAPLIGMASKGLPQLLDTLFR